MNPQRISCKPQESHRILKGSARISKNLKESLRIPSKLGKKIIIKNHQGFQKENMTKNLQESREQKWVEGEGGWRRGWRERGKKIPTAPVWGCWRNPQSILKDRHSNNWIASHNGMRKEWPTDHKRSTRTGSVTYNKATHTHTHTHTH